MATSKYSALMPVSQQIKQARPSEVRLPIAAPSPALQTRKLASLPGPQVTLKTDDQASPLAGGEGPPNAARMGASKFEASRLKPVLRQKAEG